MESIHIRQRLRPKRYAFVVREGDSLGALRAVSLNTVIWGGVYNPIVPLTTSEEYLGLLKEFDADELVDLTGGALPTELQKCYEHRIFPEDRLTHCDERDRKTYLRIGFDILPILEHIYQTEIRFFPKKSRAVLITTEAAEGWPDYVAFRFGSFAHLPETDVDYKDAFEKTLQAAHVRFEPPGVSEALRSGVSPIRLTGYGLRLYGGLANFSSHIIYVGDHSSLVDLIEFWNIRATGRTVLFVPTVAYRTLEPLIRATAEAGRYPINPHVENEADLQRAPSVPEERFNEICDWIGTLGLGRLGRKSWRPRFGLEAHGYVGDIHAADVEAQTGEEVSVLEGETMTPVKVIVPQYLERDRVTKDDYAWALDVTMSGGWRNNDVIFSFPAEPEVERVVRRSIIGMPGEIRIGRTGVVIQRNDLGTTLHLLPVKTKDVFGALFRQAGLEAEPSQPGRYTEQIIKKMGFLHYDCRVFKLRGVRQVLHQLSNGSVLRKGDMYQIVMSTKPDSYGQNWRPELYEHMYIRPRQGGKLDFTDIFNELLEKRVIRPGFTLRCRDCFGEDWYHVSEFDEEYTCRFCFSRQRVNFGSAKDWEYKADGMFRIPAGALGSLAVIVSLWRFAHLGLTKAGRYLTSVELRERAGGLRCELDYAYVVVGTFDTSYELVLGQAAGFTDFSAADMEHMTALADKFGKKPYLAFTTLKDAFSAQEKRLLNDLVASGYRVIALTREEVDPYDLYDRFEHAPTKYAVSLDDLSRNTVHLNVRT